MSNDEGSGAHGSGAAPDRMEIDPQSVIVTPAHMTEALDEIFEDSQRHRLMQDARPFQGKAHAVGACQMHMTGLINTTLTGQSMGDPARRLAGAALYTLASHLAVMEEFREIKRKREMDDAAAGSGGSVPDEEVPRESTRSGDISGVNVRRSTPPDSPAGP